MKFYSNIIAKGRLNILEGRALSRPRMRAEKWTTQRSSLQRQAFIILGMLLLALSVIRAAASTDVDRPEPSFAPRTEVFIVENWRTSLVDSAEATDYTHSAFNDSMWRVVCVPHNWDDYYGFRQTKHGNLHGSAVYRTAFSLAALPPDKRAFLFFEGVSSYATVWVDGKCVGTHRGGLTTFTLDITDALQSDTSTHMLVVRADHPAGIRDLPWICGGCEPAYGFSEGTQPFGIHRPVRLVVTDALRIEPFGIHVWNDADLTASSRHATLHASVDITNHGTTPRTFTLLAQILAPASERQDGQGSVCAEQSCNAVTLAPAQSITLTLEMPPIANPQLWHPNSPQLYTFVARVRDGDAVIDVSQAEFGIRSLHWTAPDDTDARFYINGAPFFINGVADYEHDLGHSFAFTPEQISARVSQIESAGFNALRDAHIPHNLRYAARLERDGLLWWPQFSAHNWFDSDAFRENFKARLRDWVRERRNSPSLVLWGLQNESKLPEAFAAECVALIRELDPTASTQRKITTCNGGVGVDWDVSQNWSGTYSGDLNAYGEDLQRQHLVGEYGAWRSLGFHTEDPLVSNKGPYTENRFAALMETKVRLAETVRDKVGGHFAWIFSTHSNPGRNFGETGEQLADGFRPLDHIGPANNKGLLTIWGEPTEGYYMYRSHYAPAATQPMVYIALHTWPDRWTAPGKKNGIVVYSNCESVELFNDSRSLGIRKRGARGTHFQWDDVLIDRESLRAVACDAEGHTLASDIVHLHFLPASKSPDAPKVASTQKALRVHCGGDSFVDSQGRTWLADREFSNNKAWGAVSWAAPFPNLDPATGSLRKTYDPIGNVALADAPLYQTYRYGRDQLRYRFALPKGDYSVTLHFIEPWYGIGSPRLDCTGWRLFDIALNGKTVQRDLDIWSEAGGPNRALAKTYVARVTDDFLEISFPRVAVGQAVISAIEIAPARSNPKLEIDHALLQSPASDLVTLAEKNDASFAIRTHLDTGICLIAGEAKSTLTALPLELLEADWLQFLKPSKTQLRTINLTLHSQAQIFIALPSESAPPAGFTATSLRLSTLATSYALYRISAQAGALTIPGDAAAVIIKRQLPPPPAQFIELRANASAIRAIGHLNAGAQSGIANADTPSLVPPLLTDCDWIQIPASAGAFTFTVSDHAEVYIPLSASAPTPTSFADWVPVPNLKFATTAHLAGTLRLIKTRLAEGAAITLNTPEAPLPPGTLIIVRPVRASCTYQPERAPNDDANMSTIWPVIVGVGDRYGLNFRYQNSSSTPVSAELHIIEANGHVLRTDTLTFEPTAPGSEWSILRTRTGASINAGTYQFRITLPKNSPLTLDSLEVE